MVMISSLDLPDPNVIAGIESGEAGLLEPVGAEGGRFSVSPVAGARPGTLLVQNESSDVGRFTIVPSASEPVAQNASSGMAPNGDSTPSPAGSNYTTASESGPVSLQQEHVGAAAAVAPPPFDHQSTAEAAAMATAINNDLKAQQPHQQVGWIAIISLSLFPPDVFLF